MKNLTYTLKNFFFKFSKESEKFKRPNYLELKKYENFKRVKNNKVLLSFGSGRCGQNWFSKIFNSHKNWVGSIERFADYEAFYRYITYYNLPISRENFLRLLDLSLKRDLALNENSYIASPYWSFAMKEIVQNLRPDYIFYNIRTPIKCVESFYAKGWYENLETNKNFKSPSIDITDSQYRSFSRIIPKNEVYLDEWRRLSRVGKITWFWCEINNHIYSDLNKINDVEKYIIKLEDFDQNYNAYMRLCEKFNFYPILNKYNFLNIINKAPNKGYNKKYLFKEWSKNEKNEFDKIINKFFPYYDKLVSTI